MLATTGSVIFNSTLNSALSNEEDLTINAGTNVNLIGVVGGAAGGRLDDLTVTAGNNISLSEVNVTNVVTLTATAGTITENSDAASDVLATRLVAAAGGAINLDTTIDRLTVTSAGGTVDIDETNALSSKPSRRQDKRLT